MPKKQFLVCLIAILGFLHMGSALITRFGNSALPSAQRQASM